MFNKFRRWLKINLIYLFRSPWDTGVSPPELLDFLQLEAPGRALDVGCGTGTNLLTLAENGWDVVGIDVAWLAVLRARKKLRRHGFNACVLHGDVTGSPGVSGSFDFVLDMGCYHSLSQKGRENYRTNLVRWMKPGGTYLLYAHQRIASREPHGITGEDLNAFQTFLSMIWHRERPEERPGGGGGRPALWARFDLVKRG